MTPRACVPHDAKGVPAHDAAEAQEGETYLRLVSIGYSAAGAGWVRAASSAERCTGLAR